MADAQPEPVEWGTSFGRFGADSSDEAGAEGRSVRREASTRRGRSGASGAMAKRSGTGRKPGGGSPRGAKRASSADSPFGPVVGSSADEAPDSGSAGGSSLTGRTRRPRTERTRSADPDAVEGAEPPSPGESQKSQEEFISEARAILLRQLALAPRSRHQLATKLADRGIPSEVAVALLERFEEVKLIDDTEFAHLWVRSRTAGKSLSRSAIRRELADRGIDADLAEDALLQVSDEEEHLQAREVVRRRVRSTTDLSDRQARDKEVRRLVGMLARKGYSPGIGFSIVRDVLDELACGDSAG